MKYNVKKGKGKLKSRFLFALILFSVAVLVLLWVFQTVLLNDLYKAVKVNNVNMAVDELVKNVKAENLQELTEEYAVKYDTCISVWDTHLRNIASKCVNANCRVHTYGLFGAAQYYNKARANGGVYVERFGGNNVNDEGHEINPQKDGTLPTEPFRKADNENESILFAKLINDENGDEYLIVFNAVITPIGAVVQSLKLIFVFIAAIMLLAAIAIAFAFAKFTLDPVSKMSKTAKLFAKGDYSVKFDEDSYVEISELAQTLNFAAKELSTLDATRRELIANVSHDLRTPLTLIGGYAEMMKDFPDEDNTETLGTIIDEVEHMTHLVDDMTDVSKYNSGVQKLNVTGFDLTELVQDISSRLRKLNEQYGIKIDFEYDRHVVINADVLKITQVIYNFLNNAVTHTGDDKKVKITQKIESEGEDRYVRISITDTGKGIPAEKVRIIWDRYIKIDKTYQRAHTGSGLGLNIVKSILELHGMEYGVIPTEEMPGNVGCTFWFRTIITKIK